jgi:hypothetical protein
MRVNTVYNFFFGKCSECPDGPKLKIYCRNYCQCRLIYGGTLCMFGIQLNSSISHNGIWEAIEELKLIGNRPINSL